MASDLRRLHFFNKVAMDDAFTERLDFRNFDRRIFRNSKVKCKYIYINRISNKNNRTQ